MDPGGRPRGAPSREAAGRAVRARRHRRPRRLRGRRGARPQLLREQIEALAAHVFVAASSSPARGSSSRPSSPRSSRATRRPSRQSIASSTSACSGSASFASSSGTQTGASSTRTSRASSARAFRSTRRSATCSRPGRRARARRSVAPENRFEQGQGGARGLPAIQAPDGTPLLFETTPSASAVAAGPGITSGSRSAALLLGSLLLLCVDVQVRLSRGGSHDGCSERRRSVRRCSCGPSRRPPPTRSGGGSRREFHDGPVQDPRRDLVLAERGGQGTPGVARDEADAPRRRGRDARRDRRLRTLSASRSPPTCARAAGGGTRRSRSPARRTDSRQSSRWSPTSS